MRSLRPPQARRVPRYVPPFVGARYPVQSGQKWGRGGVPSSVLLGFLCPVRGCVEPSITLPLGTSGCWK